MGLVISNDHVMRATLGDNMGDNPWLPRGLESLEKLENIFQSGKKSGNYEQTGKVREFYPKYWKRGNFSQFLFFL